MNKIFSGPDSDNLWALINSTQRSDNETLGVVGLILNKLVKKCQELEEDVELLRRQVENLQSRRSSD